MNKHIKQIIFLLLPLLINGCSKSFLEVTPKGSEIARTVHDYDLLLNNLELLNTSADAQVPMGDELISAEPFYSGADLRTQRLFRWDATIYDPNQPANEMTALLSQVYVYNKIINEVMQAPGDTEQKRRSLQAEARAGRAWCYFMLLNYYCKPYSSSTATTDPGFPIVTLADVTQNSFKRGTVQEGYDFVVADLNAALADMPAQITTRLRMSVPAAQGLLGKVYMFMGKYADALTALDKCLDGLGGGLQSGVYDYHITMQPGGVMQPGFFGPDYPNVPDNAEVLYGKQFFNLWSLFNNDLLLSKDAASLFPASDMRLQFFSNLSSGFSPLPVDGSLRRQAPLFTQFGVILPDLVLLRAEARARLNDADGAKADLESFRKNRMSESDAVVPVSDASQLVKFTMDERTREFALQGYRWFDMRRISVDPLFEGISFFHLYYPDPSTPQTITMPGERLTMRFPEKVINENPGMVNND